MATPETESASSTPLIDERIGAAGEPAVIAEINETRRRIADGSLPSFDNAADLLAFVALGGEVPGLDSHELCQGTVPVPVGQPKHLVTHAKSRRAISEGDDGP